MKVCSSCLQTKPTSYVYFHKNTNGKLGFRSTCKLCTNRDNRERSKRNYHNWKLAKRNGDLKRDYGITLDEYNFMLKEQDFKCKICRRDNPGRKNNKYFCVDHCHLTKKVRGILCSKCNSIIGFIERTNNIHMTISNIKDYLRK